MSAIENVKTFMTALQSNDMETAATSMSDDFIFKGWTSQHLDKGKFLAMQSALLAAMPDYSYNLSDVQEEEQNSKAEAFIHITGTHTNALDLPLPGFIPIAATGLAVALPQVRAYYIFEADKIQEMNVEDVPGGGLMGLIQQVGNELPPTTVLEKVNPGKVEM